MANNLSETTNDEKVQIELSTKEPTDTTQEKLYMKILKDYNETEHDGLITLSNIGGNQDTLYPVTRVENVVDENGKSLGEILEEIKNSGGSGFEINGMVNEYKIDNDSEEIKIGDFVELSGNGDGINWDNPNWYITESDAYKYTAKDFNLWDFCHIKDNYYFGILDKNKTFPQEFVFCVFSLVDYEYGIFEKKRFVVKKYVNFTIPTTLLSYVTDAKVCCRQISENEILFFGNFLNRPSDENDSNSFMGFPISVDVSNENNISLTISQTSNIQTFLTESTSTSSTSAKNFILKHMSDGNFALLFSNKSTDTIDYKLCFFTTKTGKIETVTLVDNFSIENRYSAYVTMDTINNNGISIYMERYLTSSQQQPNAYIKNYQINNNSLISKTQMLMIATNVVWNLDSPTSFAIIKTKYDDLWLYTDFQHAWAINLSDTTSPKLIQDSTISFRNGNHGVVNFKYFENTNMIVSVAFYGSIITIANAIVNYDEITKRISITCNKPLYTYITTLSDSKIGWFSCGSGYCEPCYVEPYLFFPSFVNSSWLQRGLGIVTSGYINNYIRKSTQNNRIFGVAKTSGTSGETIDVYVPNITI